MKETVSKITLLVIPLLAIVFYAMADNELSLGDVAVEKADLPWLPTFAELESSFSNGPESVAVEPSAEDTLPAIPAKPRWQQHMEMRGDTVPRILFLGDSMLEGLAPRCSDYAHAMGYEMTAVIWYGSGSKAWSKCDTLEYFLRIVNPDYLLICLGSNEITAKNVKPCDGYLADILRRIDGYDYTWIGPANWRPDTGINDLIIKHVGEGHYFESRGLKLTRSSDGVHPTRPAAARWFDRVVEWMRTDSCANPIPFPEQKVPLRNSKTREYKMYLLRTYKG